MKSNQIRYNFFPNNPRKKEILNKLVSVLTPSDWEIIKKDIVEGTKKEVLKEMQNIIDKEKERCNEANAVTCWIMLQKHLKGDKN